jgi:hypothetical protein
MIAGFQRCMQHCLPLDSCASAQHLDLSFDLDIVTNTRYYRYISPSTAMMAVSDGSMIPYNTSTDYCFVIPDGPRIGLPANALVAPPPSLEQVTKASEHWSHVPSISDYSQTECIHGGAGPNDTALFLNVTCCTLTN